jgi:hypothetical protein
VGGSAGVFDLTGVSADEETFRHEDWEECWTFEPPESSESFKIMEAFADQIGDLQFREKLFTALNRKQPFARFKALVNASEYQHEWFGFKKEYLKTLVKEEIFYKLNKIPDEFGSDFNGLYNDDGTKMDIENIPLPSLCVICRYNVSGDPEDNILCLLNRNDQRDDDEFQCGKFEKI